MRLSFSKFSASGNTTVFLHGHVPATECAQLCAAAISDQGVGGEQAGFVDLSELRLTMGGGEFCANACRAFGALLNLVYPSRDKPGKWQIRTGSQTVLVDSVGVPPHWHVKATFTFLDPPRVFRLKDLDVVRLPGIIHALVGVEEFPDPASAMDLAREALAQPAFADAEACGVIFWCQTGNNLEIQPWVQVRALNTFMKEGACGSGSLALAHFLADRTGACSLSIRQPSGSILEVKVDGCDASVAGEVDLLSMGEVWLTSSAKPD